MVFFNYALRKLNAKIVYYGPGLCGKTTNLAWIHDHFEGGDKGKMISLATEGDRTIFFDLLPLEIGAIRGMDVTLQLYTVPGQVHYNSTRQLVLRGADGVVFVADSQRAMQTSNADSLKNLQENLLLQGISLDGFPLVLQFNKRDLRDIVPVEEMNHELNRYTMPIFEATATQGVGVQETLEGIVKLVMRSLRERYEGATGGARPQATPPPASASPPVSVPSVPPPAATPVQAPPPVSPHRPTPAPQQPVTPPAASPPPQAVVPPPAAQPPVQAPPPVAPVTPPPAVQPPAEPPPPAQPPVVPPPASDVFSPDLGAQTTDFSKTQGPEIFGQGGAQGFEDEVNTDVYGDGSEAAAHAAASLLGEEPFGEIPTDPKMQAPSVDEVSVAGTPMEPIVDVVTPDAVAATPEPAEPAFESEPEPEPDMFELDFPGADGGAPAQPFQEEPPFTDVIVGPEASAPPAADPPPVQVPEPEPVAEAPPVSEVPTGLDFFEDRIDAPSPFAPQPGDNHVLSPELFEAPAVKMPGDDDTAVAAPIAAIEPEAAVEATPIDLPAFAQDSSEIGVEDKNLPMDDLAAAINELGPAEPVVESGFDPFAEPDVQATDVEDISVVESAEPEIIEVGEAAEPEIIETVEPAAIEPAAGREVNIQAEDNQLHLRLQGTGAIVESGQVRELDIEVPVPGAWVGHIVSRLQLA